MAVYAIPVGCYLALMLLVISMEEGGDNLSTASTSLTEAVVLLSQGIGFSAGALTITIMPLLLTVLLVTLTAQFARRIGGGLAGFLTGTIAWGTLNVIIAFNVGIPLTDGMTAVALKTAFVFAFGFALGTLPGSEPVARMKELLVEHLAEPVRRTLRVGSLVAAGVMVAVLAYGLGVVIWWIIANHDAMAALWDLNGMGTGSRILTTIAFVAWLPNAVIWAASWASGAGFAIGDIASFTMWSGQGQGLPALPVFGLLPEAIDNATLRMALQLVVPVTAAILALLALLLPRAFRVRFTLGRHRDDNMKAILSMAYPAGAFCLTAGLTAVGMTLLFAISNGALGSKHLAHVGVDVMRSTQAIGRTAAMGLLVAWLAVAVALAAAYGIHWIQAHHHKEAHTDDNDEPSDQAGTGIGLS